MGDAKMGASSIEALAGCWTESSSRIASAKSATPIAASYLRSTHTRRFVRSQHAGPLGTRRDVARALGVELAQHGRADGDVDARVERACERLAEGVDPRRRNLEKAKQGPAALGDELPAA